MARLTAEAELSETFVEVVVVRVLLIVCVLVAVIVPFFANVHGLD